MGKDPSTWMQHEFGCTCYMTSDETLVHRALRADHDAYGALHDKYASSIRRLFLGVTGDIEMTQDLTQEVFLRGYRQLATLQDSRRFGSWLMGIAHHVKLHWLRQHHQRAQVQLGIPTNSLAVDGHCGLNRDRMLAHVLSTLTDRQRIALVLVHVEGKSMDEARDALELSKSGFYKVLRQARDRFRSSVERGE